ncbi:MAG: hypothetical protein AB1491_02265 [Thermodesulfobacteriota bacterium]
MSSDQYRFEQFLAFLKDPHIQKYPNLSLGKSIHVSCNKLGFDESCFIADLLPYAINIMESGIFYKGKLKGRKISNQYRLYNIDNLEALVLGAVIIIDEALYGHLKLPSSPSSEIRREYEAGNVSEDVYDWFFDDEETQDLKTLLFHYDNVSEIILAYKGARPEKVIKIREELESMVSNTIRKMPISPSRFPICLTLLLGLFKKFVPDAPKQTIAARVQDVLTILKEDSLKNFEKTLGQDAIRKRLELKTDFEIEVHFVG